MNRNERRITDGVIKNSLKTILKRLKLSGILATLPERIAYAQKAPRVKTSLELPILQDEVDRPIRSACPRRSRNSDSCKSSKTTREWRKSIRSSRAPPRHVSALEKRLPEAKYLFMAQASASAKPALRGCSRNKVCRSVQESRTLFIRVQDSSMFLNASSRSRMPTTRTKRRSDAFSPPTCSSSTTSLCVGSIPHSPTTSTKSSSSAIRRSSTILTVKSTRRRVDSFVR